MIENLIGFIPIVGDAFDIYNIAKKAPEIAKRLEKIQDLIKTAEARLDAVDNLKTQWRNVNFDSLESSLGYHANKHGNSDVLKYMRQAEAFNQNLKGATKVDRTLENGESGVKYLKNGKYIILDSNKKMVSYGDQ